jgi:hypothetical protein
MDENKLSKLTEKYSRKGKDIKRSDRSISQVIIWL